MEQNMIVNSLNTFAFDFCRVLSKDSTKNEFISPFSVLTALNMTLLGAKNKTETELFQGLRFSLGFEISNDVHAYFKQLLQRYEKMDSCDLNIANRVLIHKSENFKINPEYEKQLRGVYRAQVSEVNFETESDEILKMCNEWVNKITKGKIPTILEHIEKDFRAVLINAIYFKGIWSTPFDDNFTQDEPFYNFGDKEKQKNISMMKKWSIDCSLYSTSINGEKLRMLEIPYKGSIVMSILMTKSINGLQKIETDLNNEVINKMKFVAGKISMLWLPKFKMETEYDLIPPLTEMGVVEAFSGSADFSGIAQNSGLTISRVIHKAAIEVNEKGTVAAASTLIAMSKCSSSKGQQIEFVVDHPFIFIVKDKKSEVILFAGRVNEL